GADGKIIGANRSALDQLDISCAALRMHSLASLFGTSASAVFDHFRAPLAAPMRMSLPDGRQFHVGARFDGSMRAVIAGLGGDEPVSQARLSEHTLPGVAARLPNPAAGGSTASGRLSGLHYLKTGDAQIDAVVTKVQRVLNRDIPLLILGETGTGKVLLARAVHQDSNRA